MLVITSNWGLADGSLAPTEAGRVVPRLEAIRHAVVRAGLGCDGQYRPIPSVTVVFAGDTFDWLLSDIWADRVRPWQACRAAAEARLRVTAATVRAVKSGWWRLQRWTRRGLPIPAADRRGRPTLGAETIAAVHVVLLAGDRDRWLADLAAAAGRSGLFVGHEWDDGVRRIRHGHDLDPIAGGGDGEDGVRSRPPTLAESLAIDLVVPFAVTVRADPVLWPFVRPVLGRLVADRPAMMALRMAALIQSGSHRGLPAVGRGRLASLWRSGVARWHLAARRSGPVCETEFEALDAVACWLERLDPCRPPPAAIHGLDPSADRLEDCREIVTHAAADDSPALACHLPDGRSWRQALEPAPPSSAVVAVGSRAAGGMTVDAA